MTYQSAYWNQILASKDKYFAYLLFYGFKGYQQMTDEEIKYEYDERHA